ncbi:MAG: hypothetical protein U5K74_06365 [Gemmatimonadaceae bacterium]|nr:hypothetical protein [Gemmatimonadaceae bacterium]
MARVLSRALLAGVLLLASADGVLAQRVPLPPPRDTLKRDSTVARVPARRLPSSVPDSLLRPPISPKAAFLHSLLLPGWGQSALRRSTAATLFSAAEIGAIYMVGKARADLNRAKALRGLDSIVVGDPSLGEPVTKIPPVEPGLINARKLHLEDWLAVWIFNHLLAGADAYVAANLWDLPARVSIQHTPVGPAIGAQIRW